ncbi:hypothetical protein ACFE04_011826 [Oxalis oulophora]
MEFGQFCRLVITFFIVLHLGIVSYSSAGTMDYDCGVGQLFSSPSPSPSPSTLPLPPPPSFNLSDLAILMLLITSTIQNYLVSVTVLLGKTSLLGLELPPVFTSPRINTPPTPDPANEDVDPCKYVDCGFGTCKDTTVWPLNFECDCMPGWTKFRYGIFTFPVCNLPNCTMDFECGGASLAPPPPPPPPPTFNLTDPCSLVLCIDGVCVPDGSSNYTCNCYPNATNVFGNPKLPCFNECSFGADCSQLGLGDLPVLFPGPHINAPPPSPVPKDANAENVFARTESFKEGGEDEEALRWAALQRLPTYARVRRGIFKDLVGEIKEIDVRELESQQHKLILQRLVNAVDDDPQRFFNRMRSRFDAVDLQFPKIEVRFQNMIVESFVHVGSRALPTIPNFIFNMAEVRTYLAMDRHV